MYGNYRVKDAYENHFHVLGGWGVDTAGGVQ